ncbi:MAG: UDP-N-acetylmuramoyl-L-alanyl-D-glutamate--2,6-diaminopimelate ligase [Quisquiliibacterium sp.]
MQTQLADPGFIAPIAAQAAELGQWLRQTLAPGATLRGDSRLVEPGDAFFAVPGLRADGRAFIGQAIARGARAVVYEQGEPLAVASGLAMRPVQGLRELAGQIASEFHGRPSEALDVVAVTGTNGKTSTTQWIARGLQAIGRNPAVIGTLGCGPLGALQPFDYTTPDALQTQALLAGLVANKVDVLAMEASSIGLDQGRVNGTRIRVAAFTNLTRDHLDYHGSMQDYALAKAALFHWPGLQAVVVNGDDEYSLRMLAAASSQDPTPTRIVYGFAPSQFGARGDAVLTAEGLREGEGGSQFFLGGDFGRAQVRLKLLGAFNVSNALAVAGCWLALGIGFDQVAQALEGLEPVPGRLQFIEHPAAPLAVIDYAHTPDALASVLGALRPVAEARGGALWCVFGAGGDRDAGKRPMMGMVAERHADRLVITSDNPRGESPFRIVSDLRAGLTREPELTELDRRAAIGAALQRAAASDVVLIAGKGHERHQEIAGVRHAFSDLQVAQECLAARASEAADV